MDDCMYHMGLIDFTRDDLSFVVEAINHVRSKGVTMSVGTFLDKGDSLRLPVGICCRSAAAPDVKHLVESVLDTCRLTWKAVNPSLSATGSLRAARTIDAARNAGDVTVDDVTPPRELGDAFEGLIGRDDEVALARKIALAAKAFGRDALESLHMVLMGNPGVGKTEFARRLAAHFRKQGIISGKFHIVSAADLICDHVGSAPRLVRSAFDMARDGILFIDEAYALTQGDGNEFGVEAVNALVECMDSRRNEVIVIAAGYSREMDEFLSTNPGLRERFGFEVSVKDYSANQLGGIYKHFAKSKSFALEDELVDETIESYCERLMKLEGFAGARTVRKVFTESILSAAERHPESRSIGKQDIDTAVEALTSRPAFRGVVGFV